MRIIILGKTNSWHVAALQRAAHGQSRHVRVISFDQLHARVGLATDSRDDVADAMFNADGLLVRSMPRGSLEQIIFRMDVLGVCHEAGVRVVNSPRSLEIAIDKYLGLQRLEKAGLPIPPTIVCQTVDQAHQAIDALGGDVVIKPLFGSEGSGMARISNSADATQALNACRDATGLYYLQRFVQHPGYDYRLFVIGSDVWGMRRCNPSDWRLNIRLGASPEPLQVDGELRDLAIRSARAVGAEVAAVDILPDLNQKRWVLEVNAVPGWRALQTIVDCDIAARIMDHVLHGAAGPAARSLKVAD